jgi:hypothetical protein
MRADMEIPQIRPGRVSPIEPKLWVIAFFFNTALGNSTIQLLIKLGVPADKLGVTPPEQIETGQGMVLSIGCLDEKMAGQVEAVCRQQGADIHRQRR